MSATGVLTASGATHWAMAPVTVNSSCASAQAQVAVHVNPLAGPGELDMGSATLAPLQASSSHGLEVPLWADLSANFLGQCGGQPIETIAARLFYHSAELSPTSAAGHSVDAAASSSRFVSTNGGDDAIR